MQILVEAVARQRTRVIVDRQRRLTICQMTTNSPRTSSEGEGEGAGVRLVPSEWAEYLLWYSCHVLHAEAKKKTQHEKPLGKVA